MRVYAPPDETEAGRLDRVPHGGEVTAGIAHAAADFGSRRGRDFDLATWLYREPALARQCAGGIKPGQRGSNPLVVDGRGIVIAVANQPLQFDAYYARRARLEADAVHVLLGGVLREQRTRCALRPVTDIHHVLSPSVSVQCAGLIMSTGSRALEFHAFIPRDMV